MGLHDMDWIRKLCVKERIQEKIPTIGLVTVKFMQMKTNIIPYSSRELLNLGSWVLDFCVSCYLLELVIVAGLVGDLLSDFCGWTLILIFAVWDFRRKYFYNDLSFVIILLFSREYYNLILHKSRSLGITYFPCLLEHTFLLFCFGLLFLFFF